MASPAPGASPRIGGSPAPSVSTPSYQRHVNSHATVHPRPHVNVCIDPVTLVINECMIISSAMRKLSRWSQSGVAAILGAGDMFGSHSNGNNDFDIDIHSLNGAMGGASGGSANGSSSIGGGNSSSSNTRIKSDSPLLSSFFQLRSILSEPRNGSSTSIDALDSLTLLQPFLLVIKSSSTSGHITLLALNSISKFLNYNIISMDSINIQNSAIQIISSLTHCRFEAADQNSDDAVLLKVLRLLEQILESELSNLLPNEVVSEVVQTCLSLACNKKRSEVLRKSAEMSMFLITFRIFSQLKGLPLENVDDDLQTNFQNTQLPEDIIGGTENGSKIDLSRTESRKDSMEEGAVSSSATTATAVAESEASVNSILVVPSFGIVCINEFLGILISMISPTNQYQHMESTRVFALSLITTAIEVSGDEIVSHPSLMSLVSDSICKHDLQIMTTSDSPALLQASLQLFTTIAIVLGKHLKSQIELALTLIFRSILPTEVKNESSAKKATTNNGGNNPVERLSSSKEMLIESVSLLWITSPMFFTNLFINYDCEFDRSDLSTLVLNYLCELSLPESASVTTDNVPPICLESVLSFVSSINDRIKKGLVQTTPSSAQEPHKLIADKDQKMSFVKCTELLNKSPKEGIKALNEKGFIKDLNDIDEISHFFFTKSGRLNKKVLGEYLAKPSNSELLKKFIDLFEFEGLRVDEALRILLKTFRLPGESQQIERIVETFAEKYVKCQEEEDRKLAQSEANLTAKGEKDKKVDKSAKKEEGAEDDNEDELVRPDKDAVFILSYSIIMLNTDQHNPQVKEQMTLDSYKRNLRGIYHKRDFPAWYLSKIYSSIRDREIIMPEEHHGTDKWFDDVWHNLISSQGDQIDNEEVDQEEFKDLELIIQFDKEIFKETVDNIISTLIRVFKEASDDHIITRLMSSIDKCASICIYFNLTDSIDKLINELADQTRLVDKKYRSGSEIASGVDGTAAGNTPSDSTTGDNSHEDASSISIGDAASDRDEIPITQIQIDKGKADVITVSEMAVWFGREFKAQISMVVLFRLIKKVGFKVTSSWNSIVKIILTLFENCLINPNLFGDFQKKLNMTALPKVKPKYVINRSKPMKDSGLLSTFSSFLKGYLDVPPEPTDQEVESTLSTIDCVKSINIPSIFEIVATKLLPEDLAKFCNFFLNLLPVYHEVKTKRFYESEVLFIFEIAVCFSLLVNEKELIENVLQKLQNYNEHISKKGQLRLATYKLLLFRKGDSKDEEALIKTIKDLSEFDNEALVKNGLQLIPVLLSLADHDSWCQEKVLSLDTYWTIFRVLSTVATHSRQIIEFISNLKEDDGLKAVHPGNFMVFLGLLDELSSLGAIGSQYEQQIQGNTKTPVEYPKDLIECSKKSITLTSELSLITSKDEFIGKDLSYSLYQALAHQCFNPCREIRTFAIGVLQLSILQIHIENNKLHITSEGIFEFVLFPLLSELYKDEVLLTDPTGFNKTRAEVLSVVSKVYLNFTHNFQEGETENIWLGILDHMISYKELNQRQKELDQEQRHRERGKSASPAADGGSEDETELEVLKNLILVLQNNGVLTRERKELWDESSKRIQVLDPELKKLLLPEETVPAPSAAPVSAPVAEEDNKSSEK